MNEAEVDGELSRLYDVEIECSLCKEIEKEKAKEIPPRDLALLSLMDIARPRRARGEFTSPLAVGGSEMLWQRRESTLAGTSN